MFRLMWIGLVVSSAAAAAPPVVHPAKIPAAEAKGAIFERKDVVVAGKGAKRTRDVITMMAPDKRFESGMYQAGPSHAEWKDKPYGVDEFMLFTAGSVTLTSIDGQVTVLGPGDAVTIPADWRGTWNTKGYSKYYVIRSRDKPLE